MTQLKTTFAGLSLRNPIIISSSSLTNSAEKNKKLERAGAGAIVLKSVFEEQIMMEAHHMATYGSPEGDDYLSTYVRSHALNHYFSFFTAEILHELCTFKRIAGSSRQRVHRTLEFADILVALPVHPLSYFICHICNDLIASLVDDTA